MSCIGKRCRIGDGAMADDLISNLPMHLLSCILDRVPIKDAARTSILSKTWRNIWQTRCDVLLRYPFMKQLLSKKNVKSRPSIVSKAVTQILLAHKGPLVKFALYIPKNMSENLQSDCDSWMSLVSTKGVKHLAMASETRFPPNIMPSYFFSCSELVHLKVINHKLHPPPNFQGFCNLTLVYLSYVTFVADMSFGPQLKQLSLIVCWGVQHLGCQLTHHNKNLNKFEFLRCEVMEDVFSLFEDRVSSRKGTCRNHSCINLQRFLSSTPNIATLILNSLCLTFLDPELVILTRLPMAMENMKKLVLYDVEFYDLRQISNMLCLIRSSPNLQSLTISVEHKGKRTESAELAAEQYFKSLDNQKMVIEQLHTVEIGEAENSKAEILFRNYLRTSSPSLKRLYWHCRTVFAERIEEFKYVEN